MEDDLDESGPLLHLESFLSESCEELDISMQNLSLDDDDDEDSQFQRTSTPNASPDDSITRTSPVQFHGKHQLTPSSKVLPAAKRFHVGGKPCGKEVTDRRETLALHLREGFEMKEGVETNFTTVSAYLGVDQDRKTLVTRVVKDTFPGVYIKREQKMGEKQVYFVNLDLRYTVGQFLQNTDEEADVENEHITNLLRNLQVSDTMMTQLWMVIMSTCNQGDDISEKLAEYAREYHTRERHVSILLKMYQEEIKKLKCSVPYNALSNKQKITIKQEMKILENICDTNIRGSSVKDPSTNITALLFNDVLEAVHLKCPLIHDMLESLVISNPVSRNILKTNAHKMVCGLQILGFMSNIRNSNTRNCFPMIFGLLCISYGAGKQFVDMLQSMGLSLHWNTIMSFLDKRLAEFQSLIDSCAPNSKPVMLLMDNVNMYHGNRRHHRLFKVLGPSMWNFTVRGLLIPNVAEIEQLFQCEESAEKAQCREPKDITAWDTFIETHPEHLKVWNEVQDNFLLQLLCTGLNSIPSHSKDLPAMNEKSFDKWLKTQDFTKQITPKYDIAVPSLSIRSNSNCQKSETLILPLSLENNATTTGTAAILEEFGKEFGVPCEHAKDYLPFDNKNQTFDLPAARQHHEFLESLNTHKTSMARTVQQLSEAEKAYHLPTSDLETESTNPKGTASQQKIDAKFKNTLDNIVKRMWEAQQDNDMSRFDKFIDWLVGYRDHWENVKDHNGRTILHAAVENGNIALVKTLVTVGVDINAREVCGATPLTIAVIKKDEYMSQYLVENFAIFDSHYFTTIPSPYDIATKLEMDVQKIMEELSNNESTSNNEIWRTFQSDEQVTITEDEENSNHENQAVETEMEGYTYERRNKSSITLCVGDQGTNKIIRGVKGRSRAAYGWCAEVPGDMHAKGYMYEVCKKVMSPGGLMHILQNVMMRKKITDESFGKKKFQEQNLNKIEEAVRDTSMAFGIAAVLEFQESSLFPNQDELEDCKRLNGDHNAILLSKMKQWMSESCEDASFKYYSQMVSLFGPLQQMYMNAVRYGHGLAREAVWMILQPLFAQSNKRNYYTEAMVHIVNFLAMWPLATRELLRRNCSVSLNGKEGHNLALDEWVESCIVQPLKKYSTGHTTVKMLQRLMANIDLLVQTRKSFQAREAFNVHPTTKHHEQDSFPDQIKAAHFVLRKKFLSPEPERKTVEKFGDPRNACISNSNVDAYESGKRKVVENFDRKFFALYGIMKDSNDGVDGDYESSSD